MHENCQSPVPGMNVCLQGACPCSDLCMDQNKVNTIINSLKDMQTHELLQVLTAVEIEYQNKMNPQNNLKDFEDIPF